MKALRLGKRVDDGKAFSVPVSMATQTLGILGQRGSGKSNTEVTLAEEFYDVGIPWVAIDPKGDWYGIRSSEDGNGPGLPVPILGGLHGDVPIAANEGAQWAELIFAETLTCVIDVSDFSKNERGRFLVDFLDRLFRLHRGDPQVRHVFFEEAHEYIPQQVGREDGRLKEAAAKIVLQGRTFGLGSSVCSQRSARLHKDVLTQIGTLVVHRTNGPQDRKAVEAWIVEHEMARALADSLVELKAGEAWVWSPEFLGDTVRVQVRRRRTYDSGATPEVGAVSRVPKTLADVDLAAIKEQMGEAIERAAANDPKKLHARIAELEQRVREFEMWEPPPPPAPIVVQGVPPRLLDLRDDLLTGLQTVVSVVDTIGAEIDQAMEAADETVVVAPARPAPLPVSRSSKRAPKPEVPASDAKLGKRERAILTVLAQFPAGRTHRQLALLTGYSAKASTIGAGCSLLRKQGYVEDGTPVRATAAGLAALGAHEPLPRGQALLAYWLGRLGRRERLILEHLVSVYPSETSHDELAVATGYSAEASTIGAGMSLLRGLELADGWSASSDFMEAIR